MPPRRGKGPWAGIPGFPQGFQDVVPWREQRLTRATALAVAQLFTWAGLGDCVLVPPSEDAGHWAVLVFDRQAPDAEPAVLGTLGQAAPLLRRAFHTRKMAEATRARIAEANHLRAAEAQVRRALARALAKVEAEEEATP